MPRQSDDRSHFVQAAAAGGIHFKALRREEGRAAGRCESCLRSILEDAIDARPPNPDALGDLCCADALRVERTIFVVHREEDDLAYEAEVSRSYLSQLEKGVLSIRIQTRPPFRVQS